MRHRDVPLSTATIDKAGLFLVGFKASARVTHGVVFTTYVLLMLFGTSQVAWTQAPNSVFASGRSGREQLYTLQLDADGKVLAGPTQITFAGGGQQESREPGWSMAANGKIVYQFGASGARSLHTTNPDGSGDARITGLPSNGYPCADARDPWWSPDGILIVYACMVAPGDYDIWIHDTSKNPNDPSADYALVTSPGTLELAPSWSPDGKNVAFVTTAGTGGGHTQISVVNVSNKVIGRLTNDNFTNFDPSWAPDNMRVAFSSTRSGGHNIYYATTQCPGCTPTQVTTSNANDTNPAWSPDGNFIAFVSDRSGKMQLYLLNPAQPEGPGNQAILISDGTASDDDPAWGAAPTKDLLSKVPGGDGQTGTVGTLLPNPLVVIVTDPLGKPVSGAAITFQITGQPQGATGATLSVTNTTTAADGTASTQLTLGNLAGQYQVTASCDVGKCSPNSAVFTENATDVLSKVPGGDGQTGTVGTLLPNPLVVQVTDGSGNPVSGIAIAFQITSQPQGAGGSLSVTSTMTAPDGTASTQLTLGTLPGHYQVTASCNAGVCTPNSVIFTETANCGQLGLRHGRLQQCPLYQLAIYDLKDNNQHGNISTFLPLPLQVVVTNQSTGLPVSGEPITFSITQQPQGAQGACLNYESNCLSVVIIPTGGDGTASTYLLLGNLPGEYQITASCSNEDCKPSSLTFSESADCIVSLPISWKQGDGEDWAKEPYDHSYTTAGPFTKSMQLTDGSASCTITGVGKMDLVGLANFINNNSKCKTAFKAVVREDENGNPKFDSVYDETCLNQGCPNGLGALKLETTPGDPLTNILAFRTMGQVGCAVTSLAMSLKFARVDELAGAGLDPDQLNQFMAKVLPVSGGLFNSTGDVAFEDSVSAVAANTGLGLQYFDSSFLSTDPLNDGTNAAYQWLDASLCSSSSPVIVGVKLISGTTPSHYVVVSGRQERDDHKLPAKYLISDPASPGGQSLDDYSAFVTRGFVTNSSGGMSPEKGSQGNLSALHIRVSDEADILVADGNGAETGFDSDTGKTLHDIPGSLYARDALVDDLNGDLVAGVTHSVNITAPAVGTYQTFITGITTGSYALLINAYASDGSAQTPVSLQGAAEPGSRSTYTVQYSSNPGSPPTLTPMPGDRNGDGVVNCADIAIVKASFGKKIGQPGFDPRADANVDGIVNVVDLAIVAKGLPAGTKCP